MTGLGENLEIFKEFPRFDTFTVRAFFIPEFTRGTLFHPIQLILVFCFETEFTERNSFGIISVTSSRILHGTSIFCASDGARVKQNLKAIAKFSGYFRRIFTSVHFCATLYNLKLLMNCNTYDVDLFVTNY